MVAIVTVLFFVFLTMAGIVSVIQEMVCQAGRYRSRTLHNCIKGMLQDDTYGEKVYRRFFRHPRIVTPGTRISSLTYISPEDFAVAMASAIQPEDSHDDAIVALPDSIHALQDGALKKRLRLALPDVFREERNAEVIRKSVSTWYDAQMNKTMEMFKSGTRFRLYVIAALVTVLFNVSPIHIIQYLQKEPQLTREFAGIGADLYTKVYDTSQNALKTASGDPTTLMGAADGKPLTLTGGGAANGLSPNDLRVLTVLFDCKKGLNALPVGWPWMADMAGQLDSKATKVGLFSAGNEDSQAMACGAALADSGLSNEAVTRLKLVGIDRHAQAAASTKPASNASPPPAGAPPTPTSTGAPPTPMSATADQQAAPPKAPENKSTMQLRDAASANSVQFKPQYGPDFGKDPPVSILLGWLITTFAAAQGAPFWFDLLKKLLQRAA